MFCLQTAVRNPYTTRPRPSRGPCPPFCEDRTTEAAAHEGVQAPHARRRCTSRRTQRASWPQFATNE
eukprot:6009148-Lingulodinium_polyedra.AAC.1